MVGGRGTAGGVSSRIGGITGGHPSVDVGDALGDDDGEAVSLGLALSVGRV